MTSLQAAGPRTWRRVGLPFLVLRVAGQAAEFVAFVLLARRLAPAEFGQLSIVFLFARYLGLVGDWGASIRGARDVARGDDAASIDALIRRREVVTLVLAAGFAAVTAAIAGAPLALLAAVVLARGLNRDWLSLGRERGLLSGASSTAQGIAVMVFALAAHTLGQGAGAVAAGYLVGLVVSIALNRRRGRTARSDARGAQRVDGWILGSVLADQVTISADTFLLAALRSTSAAGIYAAVYRIPNAWMTLVGLTVLGMLAPTTRRIRDATRAEVRTLHRRSLRVGVGAAAVIFASAIPGYFLVSIAFGHAYDRGRAPLVVLLAATGVMAYGASMHSLYVALAKDRDIFTWSLGGAVVNLAANAAFIPLWGMMGAAMATLLAQTFLVAVLAVRLHRLTA
ncbi:MAG: hypothetical protein QOK28_1570 [Actinomycetota bacterium]|jgi:O-antigen/teichoic acid export membrane protein